MINESLLLVKKHSDTIIDQTRSRPQETLEFKLNKQVEAFSSSPPMDIFEEGKWLLGMISF